MKKLLSIILCFTLGSAVYGQTLERQVIGTTGSVMTNSNSSLSFTVGEVATNFSTTSSASLSQGFQQAEEEEFVGVVEIIKKDATAIIFPNPAVEVLRIKSDLNSVGILNLSYKVLDIQGKSVMEGSVLSEGGKINISNIAKSTYILELRSADGSFIKHIRFTKI